MLLCYKILPEKVIFFLEKNKIDNKSLHFRFLFLFLLEKRI